MALYKVTFFKKEKTGGWKSLGSINLYYESEDSICLAAKAFRHASLLQQSATRIVPIRVAQ